MKQIFLLFLMLGIIQANAQTKYEKSMNKALELLSSNKKDEAIALFQRISQVDQDKWVPLYHLANTLISKSFETTDMDKRKAVLEQAKGIIADAHLRSADNSEIHTLEGLLYTGYVAMDSGTYGMAYSSKILHLHEKAIALDPNNLRAKVNKLQYQMGMAQYFGQDIGGFCDELEQIIPKFDEEVIELPFGPSGGKDSALSILSVNCK